MVLLTMEYGFLKIQILFLQGIVMQIGQKMQIIEKAPLADASILAIIWSLGTTRNKIPSLYQLLKENTLLQSCYTQLLWMKQMLEDYGIVQDTLVVYCNNTSAINISKNPVQHSRTKHIDIHHHFITELVENKTVFIEQVATKNQLVDIFTKLLTHPNLSP